MAVCFFSLNAPAQTAPVHAGNRLLSPLSSAAIGSSRPKAFVLPGDTIIPHVASGGGTFFTYFYAMNITSQTAHVAIRFYDDDGNSMQLALTDEAGNPTGASSGIEGDIGPRGISFGFTTSANLKTGWATVTATPALSIAVNTTITQVVPNRPQFRAAIPVSNVNQSRFSLPFLDSFGETTSLALVNPQNFSQRVFLTAHDTNGNPTCRNTLDLSAGQHRAFILSDALPCTQGQVGQVDVQADSGIPAVGFIFDDSGAFFTVQPFGPLQ